MRHNKKGFKLGRTSAHRRATLASLSSALITHKRITTTLVKAKALRQYVEPVINRAKDSSTHSRRQAFRHLRSKEAVKELFDDVASAIGDRPGGYTRIVKLGQRAGDAAEMATIELVDYNDVKPSGTTGTRRTRRTRRGGGGGGRRSKSTTQTAEQTDQKAKSKGVESTTVEEPVDEAQTVPVPERSEPNPEAKAAAEEAKAEAAEAKAEAPADAPAADEADDATDEQEEKKD